SGHCSSSTSPLKRVTFILTSWDRPVMRKNSGWRGLRGEKAHPVKSRYGPAGMWRLIASVSIVLPDTSNWAACRWDGMRRTLVTLAAGRRRWVCRRRCPGALFIKVQAAFKQSLDLGLAESAMTAGRANAADAARRRPPGHRLWVYPEQRGHLAGC